MELSTFAVTIGTLELLIGIPLLVSSQKTGQFMLRAIRNDLLMRALGAVMVILSFLTLRGNFSVGTDAAGLIRLVAWIGLIKGLFLSWKTEVLVKQSERIMRNVKFFPAIGVLALVVGVLMLYGASLV